MKALLKFAVAALVFCAPIHASDAPPLCLRLNVRDGQVFLRVEGLRPNCVYQIEYGRTPDNMPGRISFQVPGGMAILELYLGPCDLPKGNGD